MQAGSYTEGSTVTTTVYSIGGRSERVTGQVVGHRRNSVVVETPCHGKIVVPLAEITEEGR